MSAEVGYVYCMVTAAHEGLIKIGATTDDPSRRAKQLSAGTGVPIPFVCAYQKRVAYPFQVEAQIHRLLAPYRINDSREFFEIELHKVIELMDRHDEIAEHSALGERYPFAELFATFPDDGKGRKLSVDEAERCRILEYR